MPRQDCRRPQYEAPNNEASKFILLTALLLSCGPKPAASLSPELQKALASFEVAEGFRVELVAAEPLVADPVAMEIDENGNFYVVEMHGYPLDMSGSGKVKLLKDTDGDGRADQSIVFADSLVLPTGIMRWKAGVLVTDPPNVLYLEDTDGDGRADVKKVLLTGFARSNPQHNLNTPLFGPDNWIYLAHEGAISTKTYPEQFGDKGSAVHFPDRPGGPKLGVNADGRNVRFKPDTYQLEELSGETQYGHTFDPWGHQLLTSNANHLFHEVIAARYLKRNPALVVPDATQNLSDHGDAAEVYPITRNPNHQLLTDVGVITSSCGVTWYGGGLFPAPYENVTFVAEPVHNLVHADRISDRGASFTAARLFAEKEFLASKDAWFRPVSFYTGPDGALYVVDYHRQIIEHPEWMSEEVNRSGALYNGTDKGRIYRIVPEGAGRMDWPGKPDLGKARVPALVKALENPNVWWRRTAQRLLLHRNDPDAAPELRKLFRETRSAAARVHVLWLLEGTGQTDQELLREALADPTPGVRENAVRIAEGHLQNADLVSRLLRMAGDADAKVRFQLLCTLGFLDNPPAREVRHRILSRDIEDKWVPVAALSGNKGQEMETFRAAVRDFGSQASPGRQMLFAYLGAMIGNSRKPHLVGELVRTATGHPADTVTAWWKAAALDGLQHMIPKEDTTGIITTESKVKLLALFDAKTPAPLRRVALDILEKSYDFWERPVFNTLRNRLEEAEKIVPDRKAGDTLRADALRLMEIAAFTATGSHRSSPYVPMIRSVFTPREPVLVQKAAMKTLLRLTYDQAFGDFINQWPTLSPALRDELVRLALESDYRSSTLLGAMQNSYVGHSALSWPQKVALLNHHDLVTRQMARKILAGNESGREEVTGQYQKAVGALQGAYEPGKAVFTRVCGACHQVNGQGGRAFGPDLASLRNRSPEAIIADVLNPQKSIADGYEFWTVERDDGEKTSGVIAQETPTSLTLRNAGGGSVTIPRAAIKRLEASPLSAMPAGLESQLSPRDLADLVAFLKNRK